MFGEASPREGVGVYSFARYDPAFYGEPRTDEYEVLVLRRSCKLQRETGHIFGLSESDGADAGDQPSMRSSAQPATGSFCHYETAWQKRFPFPRWQQRLTGPGSYSLVKLPHGTIPWRISLSGDYQGVN